MDEAVKNEAAEVLADMGLTVSDVVRIALTKIAKERLCRSICACPMPLRRRRWPRASAERMYTAPRTLMTCFNSLGFEHARG